LGDQSIALPAASAVELLHKFTLIHDDIVDKDELRRGLKSFHVKYGENYAIFLGGLIGSESFSVLSDISKWDEGKAISCYKILSDTFHKLCLGELQDIRSSKLTQEEYLDMIYLKSAVLIESAAKMGAILANGSENDIQSLASFGKNFALGMQIQNDIKDTLGTEKRNCVWACSDLLAGKWNILLIHSYETLSLKDREDMLVIMNGHKPIVKTSYLLRLINQTNSVQYAQELALSHLTKAKKALGGINESEAKTRLLNMVSMGEGQEYWK